MAITENGFLATSTVFGTSCNIGSGVVNFVIDAADHQFAVKFWAQSTSPIVAVDISLSATGNTSACQFKIRIETDNAGSPSGTILGATNNAMTAGFAGPSATNATWWAGGGTNPIDLAENTGDLVVNTPYWLIVKETGTNPDASNYLQLKAGFYVGNGREVSKMDDGSSAWTHVTAVTARFVSFALKDADNNYHGQFSQLSAGMTSASHIFDNNRQGTKFKFGSNVLVSAVMINVTKASTPTNLNIKIYEGATLKISETILAANIMSSLQETYYLSTPQLLAADTDIYVILVQAGTDETDGGDNSNDYTLMCTTLHPTYYTSIVPVGYMGAVYGTSTDPTALTVHATPNHIPGIALFISGVVYGLDLPSVTAGTVIEGTTINGTPGTYHEATVAEVQDGVMFGAGSALEGTYAGGGGGRPEIRGGNL